MKRSLTYKFEAFRLFLDQDHIKKGLGVLVTMSQANKNHFFFNIFIGV